jgi:hypothetical protein
MMIATCNVHHLLLAILTDIWLLTAPAPWVIFVPARIYILVTQIYMAIRLGMADTGYYGLADGFLAGSTLAVVLDLVLVRLAWSHT